MYSFYFRRTENLRACFVTWNCAGNEPSQTFDISNILLMEDKTVNPDIYFIGLQEIVGLNPKQVLQGKDTTRMALWEQIIYRSLNKRTKYVCVTKKCMVGCYILLFARDEIKYRFSGIRTSKVKTGLAGSSGNKGAVAIRFNFDDSSFACINCHLTSGQNEVAERLEDMNEIYRRCFDQAEKFYEFFMKDH